MKLTTSLPTQIMLDDTEAFRAAIEDEMNKAFIEWFDGEIDKDIAGTSLDSYEPPRGII